MQQIWTNPSLERSFIQTAISKSELLEYLKLETTSNGQTKTIMIFPGMEYNFIFFDATTGDLRSLTGLVTTVYPDQIRIKYTNKPSAIDCNSCKNPCEKKNKISKAEPPMPTCNCVLNPPSTEKYDDPKIYFIPLANLVSVSYVKSNDQPENDKKGDTYVMLLGISATMVKAIIVRLEFFDDNIDEAVKLVEMAAGGIYDIAYEAKDGTIYESRVKVIKIEEDRDHYICKPGKGFVRENVGGDNIIYTSCCHDKHDKDDYMKEPPVPIVKIIVDTSEDFHGQFDTILLHTIRDCTLVQAPDGEGYIPEKPECCCDNCEYKTESCEPETCCHYIPPKKPDCSCECGNEVYTYTYDNKMKAIINGENVSLYIRGEKTDVSLESLVKYYLGVD